MVCTMNHNEYYSKIRCIRCHGENIESFYNTGDVVCTDCGEVLASRLIDNRLEEIVYAEDRELGNTLTRSSGLAESLGSDEICFITTNNANNDAMMSSLNRAKKYLSNPKEKMILGCLKDVNAACSRMHLIGNIKSRSVDLCTKVLQENIARSKEKTVLVAACIYLACRLEGYPRLLEEVSAWCFVSIDELMKMQSKIARKLELTCPIISAKDLVNRFVFQLGSWPHSYSYIRKALDVCQSIEEYELYPSLPPQQIAAGVIVWIALLEDFAQIDIQRLCEVSHISMNQLKAFYQLSHKMIANLVPVDLLDKCQHMTSYPMTLDKCLRSGTTVLKSNRDGMEAIAVKAEPVQDTITTPKSASSVSNATTTMLSNNSLTSKIRKRKTISTNEVLASTSSPVAIKEEEDITSMVDEDHLPTMKKPRID